MDDSTSHQSGAKNIRLSCNNFSPIAAQRAGNGIIWQPFYSSYTKASAGIFFNKADYFRGGLTFWTNNIASQTGSYRERMRLTGVGNLGIGRSEDIDHLLHVGTRSSSNDWDTASTRFALATQDIVVIGYGRLEITLVNTLV